MNPTVAGFLTFIRQVMGIDPLYLPDDSPAISWAFDISLMIVNVDMATVTSAYGATNPTSLYTLAVYNLAADNLINYAPDQPGRLYFQDLRKSMGISAFAAGVVQSASDSGTSDSVAVPEALQNLSISQLQNLKTPWGRAYLGMAQRSGTMWGLS